MLFMFNTGIIIIPNNKWDTGFTKAKSFVLDLAVSKYVVEPGFESEFESWAHVQLLFCTGWFLHAVTMLPLSWETLTLLLFYDLCATSPVGGHLGDGNCQVKTGLTPLERSYQDWLRASHPHLFPGMLRAGPQMGWSWGWGVLPGN